jgi:hypothetical protein
VLASFERVCDLVTDDDAVVALVWDGIGDGPLNVVLARGPGGALPVGSRFSVVKRIITIGEWRVDLAHAVPWDARPDWDALRPPRDARRLIAGLTQRGLLEQVGPPVQQAAAEVQARYAERDFPAQQRAIAALCGLGPGLTPAGDDWLAGWLLALHLSEDPRSLADLEGMVLEAAVRTTTLSRAFLACAAAGEADEEWHGLLFGLAHGASEQTESAVSHIASHGATSGAAMLAGFLAGIGMGYSHP